MEIEKSLAEAFIIPQRKDRYLTLIERKGGRDKWRHQLGHFPHWDNRFIRLVESGDATTVLRQLRNLGAPETCYVFSEWSQIDGKQMLLAEALSACLGYGMGTVLSCIPSRLAFYEAEGPAERFVLQR